MYNKGEDDTCQLGIDQIVCRIKLHAQKAATVKKKRISSFKSGIVGAVVGFASAVLCLFLLLRAGSLPIWPSTSEAGYTDTGRAALAIVRKNEKSGLKSLTGLTRVQINELCGTPVIIGHEDRD